MKRKRLTIIFFSVMALVATPQAMSRFNNYASAVHQEAEARWLQFLVSFGAPAIDKTTAPSQEIVQQPAINTTPVESGNAPAIAKSRGSEKNHSRSSTSNNRTFEFRFVDAGTKALELLRKSHPNLTFQFDERELINASPQLASATTFVTPKHTSNGKVKYLRAMMRPAKPGERNAAKAFEKEHNGLLSLRARVRMIPAPPVKFKREPVAAAEPAPYVPDQAVGEGQCSSEDATH